MQFGDGCPKCHDMLAAKEDLAVVVVFRMDFFLHEESPIPECKQGSPIL